jgi:hypothetical protein
MYLKQANAEQYRVNVMIKNHYFTLSIVKAMYTLAQTRAGKNKTMPTIVPNVKFNGNRYDKTKLRAIK